MSHIYPVGIGQHSLYRPPKSHSLAQILLEDASMRTDISAKTLKFGKYKRFNP
jgi:hypothetical protein